MSEDPHQVQLPTPTAFPIVAAFGLTLLVAGLVTSLVVSAVGLLVGIYGAIGWFLDVFPHPKHESVDFVPMEERAMPVKVSSRRVEHLQLGERGHRMRLPIEVHPYRSGIKGGIVGGIVMAILACIWGLIKYNSVWFPVNLLAAAGVPELANADTETLMRFHMSGLVVGIITHGAISIIVGLLFVVLLPMLPARYEWFWGGIVTPIAWSTIVLLMLPYVDPALARRVDWPWFIVCQVAFGMAGGFVVFKSEKIETVQSQSLATKLGVEAQEIEL